VGIWFLGASRENVAHVELMLAQVGLPNLPESQSPLASGPREAHPRLVLALREAPDMKGRGHCEAEKSWN